jgi:hypothetical protein
MNGILINSTENTLFSPPIPKVLPKSNENKLDNGNLSNDMIENIDINRANQMLSINTPQQPDQNPTPASGVDFSINGDFKLLVEKALQTQIPDNDKIKISKQLLESGRLESDIFINQTAENILKLGI